MDTTTLPTDAARTLGALRASGHVEKSVKAELRDNLLARMREGVDRFPGIIGFDATVLPQVERAILAGHDIVLLGERGQGKTRLIRTLVQLLDEWTPVIEGCEINDHPTARCADGAVDWLPSWATSCRSPGSPVTSDTPRSLRPPTCRSVT
jgi:Mg-chelatase subunit ChlI